MREVVMLVSHRETRGNEGTVELLVNRHTDRPYIVRITPLYQAGTVHSFRDLADAREFADSVDIADYRNDSLSQND